MGFVRTVVSHLNDTLTTDETQLALVVFNTNVTFTSTYTSSAEEFNAILDGRVHAGGWTNLAQGLIKAADIVEFDGKTRKNDTLVRKIVFFLTDGIGNRDVNLYPGATKRLREVSFYTDK